MVNMMIWVSESAKDVKAALIFANRYMQFYKTVLVQALDNNILH